MHKKGPIIVLVVLAALAAITYGYWGYQKIQRPRQLANLQAQATEMQRSLATLRKTGENLASAKPAPAGLTPSLEATRGALLSPNDGIRIVDRLTQLAERANVALTTIELNPGKREKAGAFSFERLQVKLTAHGDKGALANFFEALQGGVLPGLVVNEAQTTLSAIPANPSVLSVLASVFTLPVDGSKTDAPS